MPLECVEIIKSHTSQTCTVLDEFMALICRSVPPKVNDILSNDIAQLSRNKCPYLVISYLKKHVGPALTKTSNREWVPLYYQQL